GPQEEVDAPGPVVRVRVEEGRTVLAAGVEDVAGAGLDGDPEPECVQPPGDPVGAGGQVRGEGVEVHVVEGQADSVVAEVGEQTEGVVETEIGEAVGAVAETQGDGLPRGRLCDLAAAPVPVARRVVAHVMLTFLIAARRANHRPAGARAATRREVTGAPARAARAAWSGIVARMPPPTARWVSGGDGLSAAWKYGRAAVAA